MTQHNIVGSEAFDPTPHILVRAVRKVRRPWHPAARIFAIAGVVGVIAGLLDAAIGAPVFITGVAIVWLALWLWPAA